MKYRYSVNHCKLSSLKRECERIARKRMDYNTTLRLLLATQLIEGLAFFINEVWNEERTLEDLLGNAELTNLDALCLLQKAKELKEKLK